MAFFRPGDAKSADGRNPGSCLICGHGRTAQGRGDRKYLTQPIERRNDMIKQLFLALALVVGLGSAAMAAEPVDVNNATAEELAEALNGVGETKAEAIIRYREANGPFKHVDELINVRGIGMTTVDKNRDMIRLESEPSEG
jgi:competence protein ComEA